MATPKGMRAIPVFINETDSVHIYSDATQIWLQLRRDHPTVSDIGITSFKAAIPLTPALALKIGAELVALASRSNAIVPSMPETLSAFSTNVVLAPAAPHQENKGKLWTPKEEEQLRSRYNSGLSIPEIAKKHKRGVGSVSSRLRKLGLDPLRSAQEGNERKVS